MLNIILESGHYAIFDAKHGSPLTVGLMHNCFESINVIINGDYKFDYQTQDAHGLSFVGYLCKRMQDIPDEKGEEFEKLANFSRDIFANIDLDMHKA